MSTTIITPNQTRTITQYGLRMPDGSEVWASGTLTFSRDVTNKGESNGSYTTLDGGHFRGINLKALADVIKEGEGEFDRRVAHKEKAVGQFYTAVGSLTKAAGISECDYVDAVKVLKRDLVIVTAGTRAADVPDEGWEPSDDEHEVRA